MNSDPMIIDDPSLKILSHPVIAETIFKNLSLRDLGHLGMTSKKIGKAILDYMFDADRSKEHLFYSLFQVENFPGLLNCFHVVAEEKGIVTRSKSKKSKSNFYPPIRTLCLHPRLWQENFRLLGNLMKKLTANETNQVRLHLATRFINQVECRPNLPIYRDIAGGPEREYFERLKSVFFAAFVQDWEDEDLDMALKMFWVDFPILEREAKRFSSGKYRMGQNFNLENMLRQKILNYCWTEVPNEDRPKFLKMILRNIFKVQDSPLKDARILFLLFGPQKTVNITADAEKDTDFKISWIMWNLDFENTSGFEALAQALDAYSVVYNAPNGKEKLLELMIALFSCNDNRNDWESENKASVLVFTSSEVRALFFKRYLEKDPRFIVRNMLGHLLIQSQLLGLDQEKQDSLIMFVVDFIQHLEDPQENGREPACCKEEAIEELWSFLIGQIQENFVHLTESPEEFEKKKSIFAVISKLAQTLMEKAYGTSVNFRRFEIEE